MKQRVWWDILITRILQYDFLNLPSKNQELKNWFTTDLFLYSIIITLYQELIKFDGLLTLSDN